jgi:hypothetical protein
VSGGGVDTAARHEDREFALDMAAAIMAALETMANPPQPVPGGASLTTELDFKWRGQPYHINVILGERP